MADSSQHPLRQTTWLKVIPYCNQYRAKIIGFVSEEERLLTPFMRLSGSPTHLPHQDISNQLVTCLLSKLMLL
jgi:hypothetical protein